MVSCTIIDPEPPESPPSEPQNLEPEIKELIDRLKDEMKKKDKSSFLIITDSVDDYNFHS